MHRTWFVLEDGSACDPDSVAPDAAGVLRRADGRAVAYGPHGPRSRGRSAEEIEAARMPAEEAKREAPPRADREMKPAAAGRYKTR